MSLPLHRETRTNGENHFDVEEIHLSTIEEALLRLRKLAHKRVYGNREFSNDAVEDSTKPALISVLQPAVAKEMIPYLYEEKIS
ncbi:hypothetical protein DICVIV_03963 [Dictyocaulus viviparus]|uniref:Uncharacterized protein n=1 Tax=Dictyocaulus viviparus TaxID=29172 RepID=A0A0D8XZ58_DICVI|nr:hypothetical protein DICVIV_03963 [Dictyocaulus viviparus]